MINNDGWVKILLAWSKSLERDLPWREKKPRDPYHVWVSEIMLQQTRTEAVKPYYNSWMERFPDIQHLADASEDEVLHAWQGLGYYSRARNLQKAAREIVSTYGGSMPKTRKEVESLPGIGEYTAGAVLSIAYGEREPAVDGNVLRIYARLYDVEDDVMKAKGKKRIRALVEDTLPEEAGEFTEALMDLGQEICIPKFPKCKECPVKEYCKARKLGKETLLPVRTKKKPPEELEASVALIEKDGKFLMHKRPPKGMLSNMWEFPMVLDKNGEESRKHLEEVWGEIEEGPLWKLKHVFSHRVWHMKAYIVNLKNTADLKDTEWFSREEFKEIPLAGPHARLAAFAEKLKI